MSLSSKLVSELSKQINEEFGSAYLYFGMATYFEEVGYSGMSRWMQEQAKEEMAHAMKIYGYIFDRGSTPQLLDISAGPQKWKSALDAFRSAYLHEQKITALINALVDLAKNEKDNATESFLRWFVDEQVEEEDSTRTIVDKLEKIKDAPGGLHILDRELGMRGGK